MENTKIIFIEKKHIIWFAFSWIFGVFFNGQALLFNTDATDSIQAYGTSRAEVSSGRFVGHLLDLLSKRYGMAESYRYFNVLLFITFLALGTVLILEIFEVRNTLYALMIQAIVMSSAVVSDTLAYFYTAHYYGLSFLISIFSAFLIIKKERIVLPAVLLAFSLGIYQAYFSAVILIIFLAYFIRLVFCRDTIRDWIRDLLRSAFTAFSGLLLYVLINRLYTTVNGISINGYMRMGSDVIPKLSFIELLRFIPGSYLLFLRWPFTSGTFMNYNIFIRGCLVFFLLLLLTELGYVVIKEKERNRRYLLLLMSLAVPCVINLPSLIYEPVFERIAFSWYFVFITPLLLLDRIGPGPSFPLKRVLYSATLTFSAVAVMYGVWHNGVVYDGYLRSQQIAEGIARDIENRISACDNYREDDDVFFIGTLDMKSLNKYFFNEEYEAYFNRLFERDHEAIMRRYGTFYHDIKNNSDERVENLSAGGMESSNTPPSAKPFFAVQGIHKGIPTIHSTLQEVADMPSYPDEGCVKKVNDMIIVKLSD